MDGKDMGHGSTEAASRARRWLPAGAWMHQPAGRLDPLAVRKEGMKMHFCRHEADVTRMEIAPSV